MTPEQLPAVIWLALKVITIVGLCIYTIFAIVMVRQEHLMASVLEEGFESWLRILVYIHLAAAIVLVALAFLIL